MVQKDRGNLFDTGLGTSSIFKQHAFQLGCSRNHFFRGRRVLEGGRGVERCGLPWHVFLKGTQILPTNQFRGLLQLLVFWECIFSIFVFSRSAMTWYDILSLRLVASHLSGWFVIR